MFLTEFDYKMFYIGLFILISGVASVASSPALLLTPFLQTNRVQEARKLAAVDPSLFLNITSYAGFFSIDELYNSNTFFWYFPVANKPVNETPWILWLQGGPGASSLAGLFDEMGPFEYDAATQKIKARQWTWAKDHSLLFVDNPVGAGYSFTNSRDGFVRDMESCAGYLYNALRQFVTMFPELKKAPLYIAGESYAGRYLPAFGLKIHQQDPLFGKLDVNLQGIIMGNPVLNRDSISNYSAVFQQWGLIDSQGAAAVKPLQDAYFHAIKKEDATKAYDLRNKLMDKLTEMTMQPQMFNILKDDLNGQLTGFVEFVTRPIIKEAIHVGNLKFSFSNGTVHDMLITDFVNDVSTKVTTLLEHYRILIYCGQLDLTAPCVQNAQARRSHWQWNYREDFLNAPRKPWWYNSTVAGYVKAGGRLTEVLVRGAGHLVAMDKPAQMRHLISYFIRGLDIPVPPNYIPSPDETPDYPIDDDSEAEGSPGLKAGVIISVLINVLLVVSIAAGVIYALRWKRRTEAYFYSTVDETSVTEGVLSMT